MKTKRLLFIGHLWPEPTSSAAGYRTLALLDALSKDKTEQGNAYWQLYFASAAEQTEFAYDLNSMTISSHAIKLNDASFDQFIQKLAPDIVIYDRFISEEQYAPRVHEHCPDAIHILDTQDLHFLRRARQAAVKNQQPINLYTDDSIREIAAILRCDLSLIISRYEMRLLIEQFNIPAQILHYCPFMFDTSGNKESSKNIKKFTQRAHFMMIGNFLHPPNWDAVLWTYQQLWPKIHQQLPDAQLHIYGAYPSAKVWQLHQPNKGFYIKGRAENALNTLADYRVNLAPLRFGAGIKGKIADGFMSRTPCVTTTIGYEGMYENKQSAWGGLISDSINDTEQFISLAVNLYSSQTLWQQCSEQAYALIPKLFSQKQHSSHFLERIHHLVRHINEHRKTHFISQILHHNAYRSQYYMSKWIEAKNQHRAAENSSLRRENRSIIKHNQ